MYRPIPASPPKHHESTDDEMKGLFGMYPNPHVADAPAGQPRKNILDTIMAEHGDFRLVV